MRIKKIYNIHEAKTNFSKIIKAVGRGERVVIALAGKPVAEISSYSPADVIRAPGSAKGLVTIKDSFYNDLPEDILSGFEGRDK